MHTPGVVLSINVFFFPFTDPTERYLEQRLYWLFNEI